MTKYVIFCELWEKMSVPDIKNLGLDHILNLSDISYGASQEDSV